MIPASRRRRDDGDMDPNEENSAAGGRSRRRKAQPTRRGDAAAIAAGNAPIDGDGAGDVSVAPPSGFFSAPAAPGPDPSRPRTLLGRLMHLVGSDDGDEGEGGAGRGSRQQIATDIAADAASAPAGNKDGSRPFPRLPPPPPRDQLFVLAPSIPVSAVDEGEDVAARSLKAGDLLRPVWLEQEEEAAGAGAEEEQEGGAPLVGLALAEDADDAGRGDSPPRVVATLVAPSSSAAEALISMCRPSPALKGAARGVVRVSSERAASSSSLSPSPSSSPPSFSVSVSLTPAALADAAVAHPDEGYAETQFGRQLLHLLRWLKGEPFALSSPSAAAPPPSPSPSPASPPAAALNAASLFEAIRPPIDAPRVRGWDSIRGLAPSLRPYQARAVGWMVSREEEEGEDDATEGKGGGALHPLWERVWEEGEAPAPAPASSAPAAASRRRGKATRGGAAAAAAAEAAPTMNSRKSIFVNRVTGRVCLSAPAAPPRVRGGILADEMGLGKTVELLALILKQRQSEEEKEEEEEEEEGQRKRKRKKSGGGGRDQNRGKPNRSLRWKVRRAEERPRAERVDCPCGARGPASLADDPLSSPSLALPAGAYWIQCDECDAWCHSSCCGLAQRRRRPSEGEGWACGGCLHARAAEVVVGADDDEAKNGPATTLIVCPTHIVGQWASELHRHAEPGALRVVVYEGQGGGKGGRASFAEKVDESGAVVLGGRDGGVVGAGDLAAADVVIVSYETLAKEVHRSADGENGDAVVGDAAKGPAKPPLSSPSRARSRSLRAPKRYAALPTPLTRLVWGRAVLDEAQEVESGTTGAAALASRLAARRRWAVTGTPCGAGGTGGVDDLFGLFAFLRAEPWGVSQKVWREGLVRPAAAAWGKSSNASSGSLARDRLLSAMAPARGGLLWRSSKADVTAAGELGLPPQLEASTALTLSAVERHFYTLAHERTARWARAALPAGLLAAAAAAARAGGAASATAGSNANRPLTKEEEKRVLAPLTALRQACIHPSIGSRGLRLDGSGRGGRGGGGGGEAGSIAAAASAAGAGLQLSSSPSRSGRRNGRGSSRSNGRSLAASSAIAAASAAAPMSMAQVLAALTSKARLEAEDAQRALLASLNGVAGARALSGDAGAARAAYRRALATLRANAAEAGVRADPLQRLHALTNLKALLLAEETTAAGADGGAGDDNDGNNNDDDGDIEAEATEIREGYLAQWHARLAAAEADYERAVEAAERELAKAAGGGCVVVEELEEEEDEEGKEEGEGEQPAAAAAAAAAAALRKRPSRATASSRPKNPKRQKTATHGAAAGGAKKKKSFSSPLSRLAGAEHGGASEASGGWFLSAIDALQARGEEAASRSLYRLREDLEQADRYRSLASRNATSLAGRLFPRMGGGGAGGDGGGGGGGVQGLARLKPLLVDELDRMARAREESLSRLEELRRRVAGGRRGTSSSPSSCSSSPDPALVAAAGGCGRCRGADVGARGAVCDHCRLDESFLAWELSLFALTTRAVAGGGGNRARGGGNISAEDAVRAAQAAALARVGRGGLGEEGDGGGENPVSSLSRRADGVSAAEVVRHPSEAERAMRVLRSEVARAAAAAAPQRGRGSADSAEADATLARVGGHALEALALLRERVFLKARALALAQRGLLYAADELDMATTTLQLRGEAPPAASSSSRRGHEALFTLAPHELPHRAAELEAEAAAAESDLRKALGTLRYLTSLAEGDGGGGGGGEGGEGGGGDEAAAPAASPDAVVAPAPAPAAPAPAAAAAASPQLLQRSNNNPSAAPRVGMCPVCHDDFGQGEGGAGGAGTSAAKNKPENKEIAMPPCAHALCFGCFRALAARAAGGGGQLRSNRAFNCPTCRAPTLPSEVRRVVFEEEEEKKEEEEGEKKKDKGKVAAAPAPAPAPAPPSSNSSVIPPNEASIPVYGDYGTKVEAVVRRIKAILATEDEAEENDEEEAGAGARGGGDGNSSGLFSTKVLVFSTWVEALEIVAHALATNGVRAALAKGRAELGRTVAAFRKNAASSAAAPSPASASASSSSSSQLLPPRVLLLPSKQGAAGLNLTEAQHVVFLEPWLDPAAEAQAVGRVHRIGQRRETAVHRFAAANTVEDAVAALAAAKARGIGSSNGGAAAAASGRGHGAKAMQTLSVGDVSALLGLDG